MAKTVVIEGLQRSRIMKMVFTPMRLFLLSLSFCLIACKPPSTAPAAVEPPAILLPASVQQLSPAATATWITTHPGALILDLRMPEEVTREGKLLGSQNHDYLQPATAEYLSKLDPTKPYLLYCAIGGRSTRAALHMQSQGFTELAIIKGGLNAWLTEGREVIK